eukprot:CAMPEP_0185022178 /NCGR_PEP_ID=MMETSP1103-20130426/4903_1 /TAXON_ID=36769 /ORGANISM="Paraphysomonas bandaiensis, Strain Caron Lab Isolate" /LENGTH=783 /DNA_ID=CAMNT_0027554141 /DNA_START=309 /DNA_END=2660 /DNA_ORIENTATION=+
MDLISRDDYKHHSSKHPFVVQFVKKCGIRCHSILKSADDVTGHSIISPEYAQILATTGTIKKIKSKYGDIVVDVVPMLPALKIERDTHSLLTSCSGETVTLLVTIAPVSLDELEVVMDALKTTASGIDMAVDVSHLRSQKESIASVVVSCGSIVEALRRVSKLPQVLWIEQRLPFTTSNRWAAGLCQTGDDDYTPLFSINISGTGYIVGVSDTGIDMNHCQFYDPTVAPPYDVINYNHRKVVYYNTFVDNTDDSEGHGTHVSSSAAGKSSIPYGDYSAYDGNAVDAKIAFFDIGETISGSLSTPSDLNDGLLKKLYDVGAKVSSHSWGSTSSTANRYTTDARAVDSFMRVNMDALVLFAGGNSGDNGANTVGSPATNKNGICVGASMNSHNSWKAIAGPDVDKDFYGADFMAGFSSQGPTQDGRLKPDLAAPGWFTNAAKAIAGADPEHCEVAALKGTSMATPTAAGSAILVQQYFGDGWYPSGSRNTGDAFSPSGALIKAMLIQSGQSMESSTFTDSSGAYQLSTGGYPSNVQGYGKIRLSTVLNFGVSSSDPITLFVRGASDPSSPLYVSIDSAGQVDTYTFSTGLEATQPTVRVTLAYTDEIGTVGASVILVNDLTLRVYSPTETLFPLNNDDSDINNVEMVVIDSPLPNTTYVVEVSATSLSSSQPYAIVISGEVVEAQVNKTSDSTHNSSSTGIGKDVRDVIIVLSVALLVMGILLTVITISNKPKADEEEFRLAPQDFHDETQQRRRRTSRPQQRGTFDGVEGRELTQEDLERISRM